MLNSHQLRAFYEVAKSLSYSVAAKNLCVSQPAVTKQVKMFEEQWKLKLILKKRGKIYLTDEGKKIFVYASRIFELERQLEDAISAIQNLKQGSLRIGTTKTYARHFMPFLLAPFQRSFPDIIIELDEGSSLDMSKSLLDLKNSLVLVAKVEDHPDILFTPLLLEEVSLITALEHPLANRKAVRFKDLEGEPIAMKEAGSGTRKLIEQCAAEEKIPLNIIAQTSNMDFIKQLVRQKRAISFVVRSAIETELSEGKLACVPVKGHRLILDIYIARLREYELPLAARRFHEYLLSVRQARNPPVGITAFQKLLVHTG